MKIIIGSYYWKIQGKGLHAFTCAVTEHNGK